MLCSALECRLNRIFLKLSGKSFSRIASRINGVLFFLITGLKWGLRVGISPRVRFFGNLNNLTCGPQSQLKDCVLDVSDGKVSVGEGCRIEAGALIRSHKGFIEIGKDVFIGENTIIQGYGGVIIGDGCMIAAHGFISSSNHDISSPLTDDYLKDEISAKVILEKKVWIGAGVVIVAGVAVGHHSIIGAGSVVTKSVPPYSLAAGNPARIIKRYDRESEKWIAVGTG